MDENNVIQKIEEEDRHSKKKFSFNLIIAGIIGGFFGGFIMFLCEQISESGVSFVELWTDLQLKSVIGFRFLLIGSGIVIYIIALYYYKKAKSLWRDVDNREDNWEKIEQTAEIAQVYVNILNVSQLVLFAASMYMLKKTLDNSFWTYFVALIGYIFFMFAGFAITRGTINLVKEMNPEKRGSAYDMKFKEKWYESCDEAERSQIGIASCFPRGNHMDGSNSGLPDICT